jgi:hypothetical protein
VTIIGPPTIAPIILTPTGSVTTLTPAFTFGAVPGSTGYQIYLQNNTTATGGPSAVFTPTQAGCPSGIGTCSFTLPTPLIDNNNYSWIVSALNAAGQGPWSTGLNFLISAVLPPAPTINTPTGSISTTSPSFTFNAVSGATGYRIFLQNNNTSTGKESLVFTPLQANCPTGNGICNIDIAQFTPLSDNTSYSWAASALNAVGQGPYSSGLNFFVSTLPPPALTISSPVGSIITTTPAFTFNAVPGATGYQIYLQNNTTSTGGPSAVFTPTEAGCVSGIGTCSITLPTPLISTNSYSWVGSALNAAGQGPFGTGLNFDVQ